MQEYNVEKCTMKRLFCVRTRANKIFNINRDFAEAYPEYKYGISHDGSFFEVKSTAKKFRDLVGGVERGFYISRGPDHMGKHGHSLAKMRRQP